MALGASAGGVPEQCELCATSIPRGSERCPGCGRVYGEANRCRACSAIAAVREVERGRYVCAACSAPRQKGPRTPVDADFAAELSRRSTRDRVLSYVFFPVGGGLAAVGGAVLAMGQAWLEGGWETALSVVGGGLLLVGGVGLYLASRWWRGAKALTARAADAKLVLEVGRASAGAGMTVEDAALAAQLPRSDADARLTALAKQGQLELDVDDAGPIRYRVAELTSDGDDAALLAEAESELQRHSH